jgi:hypothetical protein
LGRAPAGWLLILLLLDVVVFVGCGDSVGCGGKFG